MFLTKECDYGIRIIRALADDEKKTVEVISGSEYIPEQYAYKILKKLERAGFVQSIRGRDGGYRLAVSLHNVTLHDIASAVNDNLFIFECLRKGSSCSRNLSEQPCTIHLEFERIQDLLMNEMQRKPISTLLR